MNNPFDDEDGSFLVLVNSEEQHSLWPAAIAVPLGWSTVHGPAGKQECMGIVEERWLDLRPASIRDEAR